jgi:hypothetical protein
MSALARWDAFLAQIDARHREVRDQAEAAARDFIASVAGGGDVTPLSHQLMGVRSRLQDLETKIIDTWQAKVDAAITDEAGDLVRDRERRKGDALKHALDDAREELEPRIFAELARRRFACALGAARVAACAACGQPLVAPIAFRPIELVCPCGARVPFDPGELMRSVAAVGSHAISQEATISEWRAMRMAERAMHAIRPPRPLAAIVGYEWCQIAYWRSYIAVRARFEPELARDPEMEVRSRMHQWYVASAEFEPAWVAAGRPRLI